MIDLSSAAKHVAFTSRLSDWLRSAGVTDEDARATLAVGLADTVAGVKQVEAELEAALALNPAVPMEADAALQHVANIEGWLADVRGHLEDMEPLWETHLEVPLGELGAPQTGDERDAAT
jgi:hypothetical protein